MAKNQNALKRYGVILKVLSRSGQHSSKQIHIACKNSGIPCALRTIQKDLNDLRDDESIFKQNLNIYEDKKTKKWYSNGIPKSVFNAIELKDGEATALLFYAKTMNQYRDYPIFKQMSVAIRKVIDSSNVSDEVKELFEKDSLLETEKHESISGIELITDILHAINSCNTLTIEYQKFEGNSIKTYILSPLLLKEDKQMWYVIGVKRESNELRTLALDRIKSLVVDDKTFTPIEFNSEEHFKHSFGVTVSNKKPIDVVISFTSFQGNYLRTLPIHSTQKILIDNEEEFKIQITVVPSYEFYSKIRSYGDQAKVISPSLVSKEIKNSFLKALTNYKSV